MLTGLGQATHQVEVEDEVEVEGEDGNSDHVRDGGGNSDHGIPLRVRDGGNNDHDIPFRVRDGDGSKTALSTCQGTQVPYEQGTDDMDT